ncbi:MAG: MarR family winged helix-turn-helix transcriptional regulator [Gaiellaceae bacterium]
MSTDTGIQSFQIVLDLALARSLVVRDVDGRLGSLYGLSLSELAMLHELEGEPEKRLRRAELAARLGITPSGLARQLAPLERRGIVGRESNPHDARLALVVLTERGSEIAREAAIAADEAAQRALARHWTDAERTRLAALLDRVRL